MPRGRTATLPPEEGHERSAVLTGLVVTHVNEKGTETARYDFSRLPLPLQFQNELATVFAARAKTTGKWRNIPSSSQAFWALIAFARWLAEREPVPASIAELDAATWTRWRMAKMGNVGARRYIRLTRMLLLESLLLRPETRREVIKRVPRDKPQETSYSDEELRQIAVAARRVWRPARDRVRRNVDHLRRYRNGEFHSDTREYLIGKALDHIAVDGDVPRINRQDRAPEQWVRKALGGGSREFTWKRLFLDQSEVMAAVVLLACKEGWNETSIQEMTVPERIDGNSPQPMYRVALEKRRRQPPHRYETRTLTDTAPDTTARLLSHVIEVTQPARDLLAAQGLATDRLLIHHRTLALRAGVPDLFVEGLGTNPRDGFAKASGQSVNMRRIRKAVNNRHRRRPNQNSRETHESVYLLSDSHTIEESEELIARGIERAVSHAERVNATVRPADGNIGEDTPTAACTRSYESPFSSWGVACTASFLLCLACQNAVVMPKHIGRIAYLYQCLSNRRDSIPPDQWESEWSAHYGRLHNLRTEHYSEGQWQQALDNLTESDRALVDHLLKGNLDT